MSTVLIAGASGLVGAASVEKFLDAGYDVVALSRRAPEVERDAPFRHVAVDLRDPAACADVVKDLADVTHLVYTAVYEKPGLVAGWNERDQMEINLSMLQNLMDPLRVSAAALSHVSLLQGTKAYGVHLHPIPVPARESLPRDDHENFYWLQEDYIREAAASDGWSFSIWRPQIIVGPTYGVVMNLPPVIGAYAAICREEGRPFSFPGGIDAVWEAVDARLVADALVWGAGSPAARNETFNLTNGDVFSFRSMWSTLADELGVEAGSDESLSMAEYLPSKADVWDSIVERHSLRPITMEQLLGESHHYADFCMLHGVDEPTPPSFVSTVKIRQAGFCGAYDTQQSFVDAIRALIQRRVLPQR
jgi:nucleoside-diphosphate-sugar epimerase